MIFETIIYRKSDDLIAGIVPHQIGRTTREKAIEVYIFDLCYNSELGGEPEDYGTINYDEKPVDCIPVIRTGILTWERCPVKMQREVDRAAGIQKLLDLKLTREEIRSLILPS